MIVTLVKIREDGDMKLNVAQFNKNLLYLLLIEEFANLIIYLFANNNVLPLVSVWRQGGKKLNWKNEGFTFT